VSDAERYSTLAVGARGGFHDRFWNESIEAYGTNESWDSYQSLNVPGECVCVCVWGGGVKEDEQKLQRVQRVCSTFCSWCFVYL
jgi:hypothetical protein